MSTQEFYNTLLKHSLTWRRVNNQPCIHTFLKEYYFLLCLWDRDGSEVITIDVDNIETGESDILNIELTTDNKHFKYFKDYYLSKKAKAKRIAA